MPESDLPERFRRLAAKDAVEEIDLFEGALLVSELVDPDEDLEAARNAVAELAGRVRALRDDGKTPHDALSEVLFTEEGFAGDAESYDQPSNSSVARVLARRTGMPITLSIVTIEVARLAGIRVTGVGLPGHFVVGGPDLPEGSYLDPFDRGTLYDAGGLASRLASIFGQPVAVGRDVLRPDPPRAILSRVLLNLRRSYERRDRWEEALDALACAEALEPGDATLVRERGLLLVRCGRLEEALPVLEAYAAAATGKEAEMTQRLVEALRAHGAEALENRGSRVRAPAHLHARRGEGPDAEGAGAHGRSGGALREAPGRSRGRPAGSRAGVGRRAADARPRDQGPVAGRLRLRRRVLLLEVPRAVPEPLPLYEEGFAGRLPLN